MGTPSEANGIDLEGVSEVADREGQGRVVHVLGKNMEPAYYTNGDGERKPVTVLIAGSFSALYRQTLDMQTQRMLKKRQATVTTEILAKHRLELVAVCILAWEGFVFGGKPYPLTVPNAMTLLSKAEWIRTQLEEAQNDHEGFSVDASGN